jgi:hypothetical protein
LVNALRSAGDEVALLPLPVPMTCFFPNGGWQYREQFAVALNLMMNAIESAHGPAAKNIVGGVSYGGLHSMMAIVTTGRFLGWFAHVPVTRIDALSEFPGVGDVKRFNPFFDIPSLTSTTGFISWGTADTRVNGALTKTLSQSLGAGVTKIEYVGQDHSTNAQNVVDMVGWVTAR